MGLHRSASLEPWETGLRRRWKAAADARDAGSSTAEAVRQILECAILEQVLPARVRLAEERLAHVFGVSRTPVREALLGLVNSNLAIRDAHGSLRVGAVTAEQILEVYAVRQVLEGFAAALCARASSPPVIARLKRLNNAFSEAVAQRDVARLPAANLRFHRAIAEASENTVLELFVQQLHNWVARIPSTTLTRGNRATEAIAEHEAIIEAIARHESVEAERLARDHMRIAEGIRLAMLAESQ